MLEAEIKFQKSKLLFFGNQQSEKNTVDPKTTKRINTFYAFKSFRKTKGGDILFILQKAEIFFKRGDTTMQAIN